MRASIEAPSCCKSSGVMPVHLLHCISESPSWQCCCWAQSPRSQLNDIFPSQRPAEIEQLPDVSAHAAAVIANRHSPRTAPRMMPPPSQRIEIERESKPELLVQQAGNLQAQQLREVLAIEAV